MAPRIYYAHSNAEEEQREWQRLADHLTGTAERAGAFLETAGHTELGRVAGLLHDLGKYTDRFQARLAGDGARVDHAAPGARVAIDTYGPVLGKILAFCIAGHHTGLANGTNGERITALADRLGNEAATLNPVWRAACETPGVCGLAQSSILLVNTHLPWIADWMPALEDRRHAERWK